MRETRKFNLWAKYFSDKSDHICYGNATQSAIKAYGYSSQDKYHLASVTGSKNMRKHEYLASMICDLEGFGYGDLIRIGLKKAIEGSYSDWEKFMDRLGYFPERQDVQINLQQNNFDFNNILEAINKSSKERGLPPL